MLPKATGCDRGVKALCRRHFAPQFFAAAALLRLRRHRPRARNAPVTSTRICFTGSAANAPAARRRERLSNWLALLALLAIAIV
ncbi:MAG TPA: hypothetical protein VGG67_14350 [Steroidobacteraceae bacterium]|jgi:hypothetical protein